MSRTAVLMINVAVIAFLIFFSSCVKTPPVAPLKVGIDRFVGFAPIYLARERVYPDMGIEVDPQMIMDTVERNSAFASGRIDALCTTADSLLLAASKGVDLVIIGAVDESQGADGIVAKSNILSIQDLQNKTVAFQEAMPSHFFILWLLDKNGMTKKDIIATNMNADEAGAAFMAGRVDAAVTWEPWLSKAVQSGQGRLLTSTKEHPGVLIDVLAVRRDVLERRERDVLALYKGWMKAVELTKSEPDESSRVMSQKIGIEMGDFRQQLETVRLADQSFNRVLFDKKNAASIWSLAQQAIVLWKKARVIDPNDKFDANRHITDRIVTLAEKN